MGDAARDSDIGACVFDAYGTLFDVNAAAERCRDALGDKADALSAVWRTKQLEYTWLRSLRGDYVDFWHVTGHSLDYALAAVGIKDDALRTRLMELYFVLDAYADVQPTLERIRAAGMRTAILSNGSPSMLIAAVRHAGLERLINDLLSVDAVGIYKPHPSSYQLAVDRLKLPAERICFLSANPWDVSGAALFGFRVVWINRFGRMPERLPGTPKHEIRTLDDLPPLLGL
ncbi:MAG: haloacid dehalogenase type II [Rhodospirillales bacterium]|nr:MAG: haloacid dehalogenase type II [Rhodospirillales bacterium]